jgi:hypothetical protein
MSRESNNSAIATFEWVPQPAAAEVVRRLLEQFLHRSPVSRSLGSQMLQLTGTRLSDWIDFIAPPDSAIDRSELLATGFAFDNRDGIEIAQHYGGMFPTLRLGNAAWSLGVKVESVSDFLHTREMKETPIEGSPWSPLRAARISSHETAELWVMERHGYLGFSSQKFSSDDVTAVLHHEERLRCRRRRFDRADDGFAQLLGLVQAASADLGVDRACSIFFRAERDYWMSRNRAARLQRSRQDRLGLGWGNHDHHTYRSSREHFCQLVEVLEALGFQCRERFYAGVEAGWGAQVLEQPTCQVTVFADVDLSVDEVAGDFAHQQLTGHAEVGTVGLWCRLHGEAALLAGMHHLEAQFNFDAACAQLAELGVRTMAPFTDFPFLRQAFTQAEIWPVEPLRLAAVRDSGWITEREAERFARFGVVGSHLEILERNDGYKGFNQTGISQIIRRTDPRGRIQGA